MEIIYDEFCLIDMEIINYLFIYLFYYHHKCYSKLIIIIILSNRERVVGELETLSVSVRHFCAADCT